LLNSALSPKTRSLTTLFAKNAQNDWKTHSYKDNAKIHSTFSATTLSYGTRFRRKRAIKNFEYLGEFEEDFQEGWLYCVLYLLVIERCKKSLKTD
jgi:hypothetical protein